MNAFLDVQGSFLFHKINTKITREVRKEIVHFGLEIGNNSFALKLKQHTPLKVVSFFL